MRYKRFRREALIFCPLTCCPSISLIRPRGRVDLRRLARIDERLIYFQQVITSLARRRYFELHACVLPDVDCSPSI